MGNTQKLGTLINGLTVDSSGNVGINTSSPAYRLDVTGTGRFTNLLTASAGIKAQYGRVDGRLFITNENDYGDMTSTSGMLSLGYYTTGQEATIRSRNYATSTNTKLTFDASQFSFVGGNVGIGTSSPVGLLTLVSSLTTTATTSQQAYDYSRFRINTYNGSSVGLSIGNVNGNGTYFQTCYNEGTVSPMFFNPFGGVVYVGASSIPNSGTIMNIVGTSNVDALTRFYLNAASSQSRPAIRVDKYDNTTTTAQVFIDFTVNQQTAGNGSITANGASQATFTTWSDARLKDNITELPSQLSNIMSMRPVEFDYKDGSGHQIGFIAQEIQEIYPDIVSENADGYLTISGLGKMESRLIKAMQEQQDIINELKADIELLKLK